MLNLFTEIIEKVGISILVIATPALENVISNSVRNARKLVTGGSTIIPLMRKEKDDQWDRFTRVLWRYQYVANQQPLTPAIKNTWHRLSGGNCAFASLLFYMAHKVEMGRREYLDGASFERAYAKNLSFLDPAIKALNKNTPEALALFDDLMMSPKWRVVRAGMGVKEKQEVVAPVEAEFDDVEKLSDKPVASKAGVRNSASDKGKAAVEVRPFKVEDAFAPRW